MYNKNNNTMRNNKTKHTLKKKLAICSLTLGIVSSYNIKTWAEDSQSNVASRIRENFEANQRKIEEGANKNSNQFYEDMQAMKQMRGSRFSSDKEAFKREIEHEFGDRAKNMTESDKEAFKREIEHEFGDRAKNMTESDKEAFKREIERSVSEGNDKIKEGKDSIERDRQKMKEMFEEKSW